MLLFKPVQLPLLSRSFCTCSPLSAAIKRSTTRTSRLKEKPVDKSATWTRKKPLKSTIVLPNTELFNSCANILPLTHRPTLINENTARDIVRDWGVDKMHDVTIIDVYAGPGGLTRAFLELKNVKHVISVEESFRYLPMLETLTGRPENIGRHTVIPSDPFNWETYSKIEDLGLLKDVPKSPWNQIHPSFFLSVQTPNSRHGEQLFLQFLTTAAGKMWLYQYGRFELGFLGHDPFWSKLEANPGTPAHHKLSVLVAAVSTIRRSRLISGSITPPELHYHCPRSDPGNFSPVKVTPREDCLVQNFDAMEFVTRSMFIAKSQSWKKGVTALAAGAGNLIPEMINRGIPSEDITVNQLELRHWVIVADVFDEWPFKPSTMFDEQAFHGE